jgi:trk system potassium uptake protein TrkA
MKYIVLGLGRFGSNLATNLTNMGHEVIGVDNHTERLEELKDSITTVMKMDSTNINAIKSLPLDDADAIIVAIGEDVGSSILTASILKNLKVKRIIARAVTQVQRSILKQIGIDEIILPLEDSATHVASMLQLKNALRLTELNNDYAVAEIVIPPKYAGHVLDTINIGERFNLKLIAVKVPPKDGIISSIFRHNFKVEMSFDPYTPLDSKDVLVVSGRIIDIKRFSES